MLYRQRMQKLDTVSFDGRQINLCIASRGETNAQNGGLRAAVATSDGDRRLDVRMKLVVVEREVVVSEGEQVGNVRIQRDAR